MGDHHFLIRYSFTGVVLLLFALAGLWIVNGNAAVQVLAFLFTGSVAMGPALISALATIPIIGVTVHGLCLLYAYDMRGHSFPDTARKVVAEYVRRQAMAECLTTEHLRYVTNVMGQKNFYSSLAEFSTIITSEIRDFWQTNLRGPFRRLSGPFRRRGSRPAGAEAEASGRADAKEPRPVPDDSLFVLLYHCTAPPHLIEWARRRRDYHYLGLNWTIASLLGMFVGLNCAWLWAGELRYAGHWKAFGVALLLTFWLVWMAGAFWLSLQMKQDVDSMELVWACITCSASEPKFKSNFLSTLALDQQHDFQDLVVPLRNLLNSLDRQGGAS
ncbi:MAG TPA: hypothetical protein VF546_21300 [Pyrinomonadaceae bacterium]|jgi:hypothetical protein